MRPAYMHTYLLPFDVCTIDKNMHACMSVCADACMHGCPSVDVTGATKQNNCLQQPANNLAHHTAPTSWYEVIRTS